jgi:hypothetical protein
VVRQQAAIEALDGRVLLVAYDEPELLRSKMMRGMDIPYPLLLDRTKQAYRAWGMGRTTLRRSVFSPSLGLRYVKLILQGQRFLGLAPDMLQLGGDFIVNPAGEIAFAHRMRDNGDRATAPVLMNEMRRIATATR